MKFWKRTAAMLLCLGVSFSAFGCGGKDNKGDNGDSTPNLPSTSENGGIVDLDKAESLADVLAAAKSAKMDVAINVTDADGNAIPVTMQLQISETDKGVDLMATANGETVYVIDGWAYSYDQGSECYIKSGQNIWEEMEGALMQAGVTMEQVEMMFTELETSLGEMDGVGSLGESFGEHFEASAKLEDGAMVVTLDCAPALNAVLDYMTTLTADRTLESVVNDLLGCIDPTLTAEAVLDQVATLGTMTVSEAYAVLDDIAKEETGYSIQNLKELLIMNEDVQAALQEAGATEEDIQMIDDFDIEAYVAEYGEWSLNEVLRVVINQMNAGSGTAPDGELGGDITSEMPEEPEEIPEGTDIIGRAAEQAKAFLKETTLGDLEEMLEMQGTLNTLQQIGAIEVNKADLKYGVKYDKDMKIDALVLGFALNMSNEIDGETATASVDVKITVSEISAQRVTIALPEGAVVANCCFYCGANSVDDNTIAYSEELDDYVCGECLEMLTVTVPACEVCGNTEATYYPEWDLYLCDSCYAE